MRIEGKDFISRTTISAFRVLVAASFAVSVSSIFCLSINLASLGIEGTLSEFNTQVVTSLILIFFAVSYALNLYGDWQSFNLWTDRYEVGANGFESAGNTISVAQALRQVCEGISLELENIGINSSQSDGNNEDPNRYLERLDNIFPNIQNNLSKLEKLALWMFWGWYVLLPAVLWISALLLLWCSSDCQSVG